MSKQLKVSLLDGDTEYATTLDLTAVTTDSQTPVDPPDPSPDVPDPNTPPAASIGRLTIDVSPEDVKINVTNKVTLEKVLENHRGDTIIDLPFGDYEVVLSHARFAPDDVRTFDLTISDPVPPDFVYDFETLPVGPPVTEPPPETPGPAEPEPTDPSYSGATTYEEWMAQPDVLVNDFWIKQINSLYNASTKQREPHPVSSHSFFRAVEWQSERPGFEGWTYFVTTDVVTENGEPRDWADDIPDYMTLVANYPVEVAVVGNGTPSWIDETDGWYLLPNGYWAKKFPAGPVVLGAPERAFDRVPLYDVAVRHADGTGWQLPPVAQRLGISAGGSIPASLRHDILIAKDPQGRDRFRQHALFDKKTGGSYDHEHGSLVSELDLPFHHIPLYELVNDPQNFIHSAFKDFHYVWKKMGGGTMHCFITVYLAGGLEPTDHVTWDLMRRRHRPFEATFYDNDLGEIVGHYWGSGDFGTFEATDGVGSPVVMPIGAKHDGVRNEDLQRFHGMRHGVREFPYPRYPYHTSGEVKATTEGQGGYWTFRPGLEGRAIGIKGTMSFQHNDPGLWVKSETQAYFIRHAGQNGFEPNTWTKRWAVPHDFYGMSSSNLYAKMVYYGFKNSIAEAHAWHEAHNGEVYTNDWELDGTTVITPAGTVFLEKDDPRATVVNYQKPGYEGLFDTRPFDGFPTGIRFFALNENYYLNNGGGSRDMVGPYGRDYLGRPPQIQYSFPANILRLATNN
ncbi:MAG: hypothetical protein AAF267_19165 [Deinococcota bacterium]